MDSYPTTTSSSSTTPPPSSVYYNLPLSPVELDSLRGCRTSQVTERILPAIAMGISTRYTLLPYMSPRTSTFLSGLVSFGFLSFANYSSRETCLRELAFTPELPTAIAIRQELRQRRPQSSLLADFDKKYPNADSVALQTRMTRFGPVPEIQLKDSVLDQLFSSAFPAGTKPPQQTNQQRQQSQQQQQSQSSATSSQGTLNRTPYSPSAASSSQSYSHDDGIRDAYDEPQQQQQDFTTGWSDDDVDEKINKQSTQAQTILANSAQRMISPPAADATSSRRTASYAPRGLTYGGFFDDIVFGGRSSTSFAPKRNLSSSSSSSSETRSSNAPSAFSSSSSSYSSSPSRSTIALARPRVNQYGDEME